MLAAFVAFFFHVFLCVCDTPVLCGPCARAPQSEHSPHRTRGVHVRHPWSVLLSSPLPHLPHTVTTSTSCHAHTPLSKPHTSHVYFRLILHIICTRVTRGIGTPSLVSLLLAVMVEPCATPQPINVGLRRGRRAGTSSPRVRNGLMAPSASRHWARVAAPAWQPRRPWAWSTRRCGTRRPGSARARWR